MACKRSRVRISLAPPNLEMVTLPTLSQYVNKTKIGTKPKVFDSYQSDKRYRPTVLATTSAAIREIEQASYLLRTIYDELEALKSDTEEAASKIIINSDTVDLRPLENTIQTQKEERKKKAAEAKDVLKTPLAPLERLQAFLTRRNQSRKDKKMPLFPNPATTDGFAELEKIIKSVLPEGSEPVAEEPAAVASKPKTKEETLREIEEFLNQGLNTKSGLMIIKGQIYQKFLDEAKTNAEFAALKSTIFSGGDEDRDKFIEWFTVTSDKKVKLSEEKLKSLPTEDAAAPTEASVLTAVKPATSKPPLFELTDTETEFLTTVAEIIKGKSLAEFCTYSIIDKAIVPTKQQRLEASEKLVAGMKTSGAARGGAGGEDESIAPAAVGYAAASTPTSDCELAQDLRAVVAEENFVTKVMHAPDASADDIAAAQQRTKMLILTKLQNKVKEKVPTFLEVPGLTKEGFKRGTKVIAVENFFNIEVVGKEGRVTIKEDAISELNKTMAPGGKDSDATAASTAVSAAAPPPVSDCKWAQDLRAVVAEENEIMTKIKAVKVFDGGEERAKQNIKSIIQTEGIEKIIDYLNIPGLTTVGFKGRKIVTVENFFNIEIIDKKPRVTIKEDAISELNKTMASGSKDSDATAASTAVSAAAPPPVSDCKWVTELRKTSSDVLAPEGLVGKINVKVLPNTASKERKVTEKLNEAIKQIPNYKEIPGLTNGKNGQFEIVNGDKFFNIAISDDNKVTITLKPEKIDELNKSASGDVTATAAAPTPISVLPPPGGLVPSTSIAKASAVAAAPQPVMPPPLPIQTPKAENHLKDILTRFVVAVDYINTYKAESQDAAVQTQLKKDYEIDIDLLTIEKLLLSPDLQKAYEQSCLYAAWGKDSKFEYLKSGITKDEVELYQAFKERFESLPIFLIKKISVTTRLKVLSNPSFIKRYRDMEEIEAIAAIRKEGNGWLIESGIWDKKDVLFDENSRIYQDAAVNLKTLDEAFKEELKNKQDAQKRINSRIIIAQDKVTKLKKDLEDIPTRIQQTKRFVIELEEVVSLEKDKLIESKKTIETLASQAEVLDKRLSKATDDDITTKLKFEAELSSTKESLEEEKTRYALYEQNAVNLKLKLKEEKDLTTRQSRLPGEISKAEEELAPELPKFRDENDLSIKQEALDAIFNLPTYKTAAPILKPLWDQKDDLFTESGKRKSNIELHELLRKNVAKTQERIIELFTPFKAKIIETVKEELKKKKNELSVQSVIENPLLDNDPVKEKPFTLRVAEKLKELKTVLNPRAEAEEEAKQKAISALSHGIKEIVNYKKIPGLTTGSGGSEFIAIEQFFDIKIIDDRQQITIKEEAIKSLEDYISKITPKPTKPITWASDLRELLAKASVASKIEEIVVKEKPELHQIFHLESILPKIDSAIKEFNKKIKTCAIDGLQALTSDFTKSMQEIAEEARTKLDGFKAATCTNKLPLSNESVAEKLKKILSTTDTPLDRTAAGQISQLTTSIFNTIEEISKNPSLLEIIAQKLERAALIYQADDEKIFREACGLVDPTNSDSDVVSLEEAARAGAIESHVKDIENEINSAIVSTLPEYKEKQAEKKELESENTAIKEEIEKYRSNSEKLLAKLAEMEKNPKDPIQITPEQRLKLIPYLHLGLIDGNLPSEVRTIISGGTITVAKDVDPAQVKAIEDRIRKEFAEKLKELQSGNAQLQAEKDRVKALEAQIATIESHKSELTEIKAERESLKSQIADLQSQIGKDSGITESKDDGQTEMSELQNQLRAVKARELELQTEVDSLRALRHQLHDSEKLVHSRSSQALKAPQGIDTRLPTPASPISEPDRLEFQGLDLATSPPVHSRSHIHDTIRSPHKIWASPIAKPTPDMVAALFSTVDHSNDNSFESYDSTRELDEYGAYADELVPTARGLFSTIGHESDKSSPTGSDTDSEVEISKPLKTLPSILPPPLPIKTSATGNTSFPTSFTKSATAGVSYTSSFAPPAPQQQRKFSFRGRDAIVQTANLSDIEVIINDAQEYEDDVVRFLARNTLPEASGVAISSCIATVLLGEPGTPTHEISKAMNESIMREIIKNGTKTGLPMQIAFPFYSGAHFQVLGLEILDGALTCNIHLFDSATQTSSEYGMKQIQEQIIPILQMIGIENINGCNYHKPYVQSGQKHSAMGLEVDPDYQTSDCGVYAMQVMEDIAKSGFAEAAKRKYSDELNGPEIVAMGAKFRARQAAKMIILGKEENISGIENFETFKSQVLEKNKSAIFSRPASEPEIASSEFTNTILTALSLRGTELSRTHNGFRFKIEKDNYCLDPTYGTLYKNHKYIGDSKKLEKEFKYIKEFAEAKALPPTYVIEKIPSPHPQPTDDTKLFATTSQATSSPTYMDMAEKIPSPHPQPTDDNKLIPARGQESSSPSFE